MEEYGAAKARLFEAHGVKHRIINADDEFGRQLARRYPDAITYATSHLGPSASYLASNIALSDAGVRFTVDSDSGRGEVRAGALGAFNVSNLLAVLATLVAAGLTFDDAVAALGTLEPVPGRLERVGGGALPLVVVDYAHTPDALEKPLDPLRPPLPPAPPLFSVFVSAA